MFSTIKNRVETFINKLLGKATVNSLEKKYLLGFLVLIFLRSILNPSKIRRNKIKVIICGKVDKEGCHLSCLNIQIIGCRLC